MVHTPAAQQPDGQEAASQTQAPSSHRCPGAHAGFTPQRQPPPEQASARFGSQLTHALPSSPQVVKAEGLQVAPEQQPEAQLVALHPLHAPLPQDCPCGHAWHAAPPAPHAVGSFPGTHRLSSQQPAQVLALQTQVPATQRWPAEQAPSVPQRQLPSAHPSARFMSHLVQVAPFAPQRWTSSGTQTP